MSSDNQQDAQNRQVSSKETTISIKTALATWMRQAGIAVHFERVYSGGSKPRALSASNMGAKALSEHLEWNFKAVRGAPGIYARASELDDEEPKPIQDILDSTVPMAIPQSWAEMSAPNAPPLEHVRKSHLAQLVVHSKTAKSTSRSMSGRNLVTLSKGPAGAYPAGDTSLCRVLPMSDPRSSPRVFAQMVSCGHLNDDATSEIMVERFFGSAMQGLFEIRGEKVQCLSNQTLPQEITISPLGSKPMPDIATIFNAWESDVFLVVFAAECKTKLKQKGKSAEDVQAQLACAYHATLNLFVIHLLHSNPGKSLADLTIPAWLVLFGFTYDQKGVQIYAHFPRIVKDSGGRSTCLFYSALVDDTHSDVFDRDDLPSRLLLARKLFMLQRHASRVIDEIKAIGEKLKKDGKQAFPDEYYKAPEKLPRPSQTLQVPGQVESSAREPQAPDQARRSGKGGR